MTDRYENPLPVLSADADELVIETTDVYKGRIVLKNAGGGVLKGNILSRLDGLLFETPEFEGNNQTINFSFNAAAAGLGIGETVTSRFFITSNGGEKEIPVSAKLIKMSISTPDGATIANINDFYEYSLNHASQARRIFIDSEFYMLLLASGYEYMEVYESLHKDANRERAMDNFFILSGLKGRTTLEILNGRAESPRRAEFSQIPANAGTMTGSFRVKKSDKGYVEAPLILRNESPWLTLSSGKLTASDFDSENTAAVNFTVDPKKIKHSFATEQIIVGGDEKAEKNIFEIVYRRLPQLVLKLNRETYRYADKGAIEVINNTGANMQIDVFCAEHYIRFASRSYSIGARGEIPFEIKLSAFMNAQMLFRKMPYMRTVIEVNSRIPGAAFKKTIPVTVGEW